MFCSSVSPMYALCVSFAATSALLFILVNNIYNYPWVLRVFPALGFKHAQTMTPPPVIPSLLACTALSQLSGFSTWRGIMHTVYFGQQQPGVRAPSWWCCSVDSAWHDPESACTLWTSWKLFLVPQLLKMCTTQTCTLLKAPGSAWVCNGASVTD